MLPLITIQKLSVESGYTEDAIRSKINRGEWAEGIHFIKSPDGRIQIKVEEYIKWVESKSMVKVSKSRSTGAVSATAQR